MNRKKRKKKSLPSPEQSGLALTIRDNPSSALPCSSESVSYDRTTLDHTPGAVSGDSKQNSDTHDPESSVRNREKQPILPGSSLFHQLRNIYGYEIGSPSGSRYELGHIIGSGGGGRVFEIVDSELGREIAAKFTTISRSDSHRSIEMFLKEARTMACLTHPNVVPVYDVGITGQGDLFFTMKQVKGRSLGDAIRSASQGKPAPEIATINDIVNVFLKICEAVAYAHSKDIVHQDIKPDNVMIGEFGEVLLLDWGCSSSAIVKADLERGIAGTPAYMSPEQARREPISSRSDIYCIGSSLFHTLTHRYPTSGKDPAEFWSRKKQGIIDPLTPGEMGKTPEALLAIALKAIDPTTDARYASATELANDLRKYQAGLAISWRPFATVAFTDMDRIHLDWILCRCIDWKNTELDVKSASQKAWTITSGVLRGTNGNGFDSLAFRRKIRGNLRVTWKIKSVLQSENLNFFIAGDNRLNGYLFHIGGFGDSRQIVLTRGAEQIVLDQQWLEEPLRVGVWHDLAIEKENTNLRLSINGATVISCSDPDMLTGKGHQTFGFEVCNKSCYEISDVKIYYQPTPPLISPIEVGDRFFDEHYYNEAIEQYEELIESYPESELAERAQFKVGHCRKALGDIERAVSTFRAFASRYPGSDLVPFSLREIARLNMESAGPGAIDEIIDELAAKYQGHPVLRALLFDISFYYQRKRTTVIPEQGKAHLEIIAEKFGLPLSRSLYLRFQAADCIRQGHYKRVLLEYSYLEEECAEALIKMGRAQEVISRYPHLRIKCAHAHLALGHMQTVIDEYPDAREECAKAHQSIGHHEMVLRLYPDQRECCAEALMRLHRYQEVIDIYLDQRWTCVTALMKMKRLNEALAFYPGDRGIEVFVLMKRHEYQQVIDKYPEQKPSYAKALQRLDKHEIVLEKFGNDPELAPAALIALGREREIPARFPQNRRLLAKLLIMQAKFQEILSDYSDLHDMCASALAFLGRTREAVELYPERRKEIASFLHNSGRYNEVLEYFSDQTTDASKALISLGRSHEVLERFPQNSTMCARALLSMGDFAGVLENYPAELDPCALALIMMGQFETALEQCPDAYYRTPEALIGLGRIDELLKTCFSARHIRLRALIVSGESQIALERYRDEPAGCVLAHLALSEPEAALARYKENPQLWREIQYVDFYRAVRELTAGNIQSGSSMISELTKQAIDFDYHLFIFPRFILPAFIKALPGNREQARDDLRRIANGYPHHFARRLWYQAAFISGQIDLQEFTTLPFKQFMEAETRLCSALRHEISGSEGALPLYQNYASLPAWKKELHPVIDLFVNWRITMLLKSQ